MIILRSTTYRVVLKGGPDRKQELGNVENGERFPYFPKNTLEQILIDEIARLNHKSDCAISLQQT